MSITRRDWLLREKQQLQVSRKVKTLYEARQHFSNTCEPNAAKWVWRMQSLELAVPRPMRQSEGWRRLEGLLEVSLQTRGWKFSSVCACFCWYFTLNMLSLCARPVCHLLSFVLEKFLRKAGKKKSELRQSFMETAIRLDCG